MPPIVYTPLQCCKQYSVSQKIPSVVFPTFFLSSGWEFLINFYTPIVRFYVQHTRLQIFYSIIFNFDEVMPY